MSEQNEWLGWHFLSEDRRLGYDDGRLVIVGETLKMPEGTQLKLCKVGLHASKKAIDALIYAPGPIVCRVRLSGEVIDGDDKAVASERAVLAMADATDVLHEFACLCAESGLHLTGDARPICEAAIATKRRWLKGEATTKELDAAFAAACPAVGYAAWHDALHAALHAACYAASYAASSAACSAARISQEAKLTEMLNQLLNQENVNEKS